MIRVIVRKRLAPGQSESTFINAWLRCNDAICGRARGALGGMLLRDRADPNKLVAIMRWNSLEDWLAYWGGGIPDPEGDADENEILIELAELDRIDLSERVSESVAERAVEGGAEEAG